MRKNFSLKGIISRELMIMITKEDFESLFISDCSMFDNLVLKLDAHTFKELILPNEFYNTFLIVNLHEISYLLDQARLNMHASFRVSIKPKQPNLNIIKSFLDYIFRVKSNKLLSSLVKNREDTNTNQLYG